MRNRENRVLLVDNKKSIRVAVTDMYFLGNIQKQCTFICSMAGKGRVVDVVQIGEITVHILKI